MICCAHTRRSGHVPEKNRPNTAATVNKPHGTPAKARGGPGNTSDLGEAIERRGAWRGPRAVATRFRSTGDKRRLNTFKQVGPALGDQDRSSSLIAPVRPGGSAVGRVAYLDLVRALPDNRKTLPRIGRRPARLYPGSHPASTPAPGPDRASGSSRWGSWAPAGVLVFWAMRTRMVKSRHQHYHHSGHLNGNATDKQCEWNRRSTRHSSASSSAAGTRSSPRTS
jgi:hypothetical protein